MTVFTQINQVFYHIKSLLMWGNCLDTPLLYDENVVIKCLMAHPMEKPGKMAQTRWITRYYIISKLLMATRWQEVVGNYITNVIFWGIPSMAQPTHGRLVMTRQDIGKLMFVSQTVNCCGGNVVWKYNELGMAKDEMVSHTGLCMSLILIWSGDSWKS